MKKINYINGIIIILAALLVFSCSNITSTIEEPADAPGAAEETNYAVLRFNVKDIDELTEDGLNEAVTNVALSRTVVPVITVNDLSELKIKGWCPDSGVTRELGIFENITALLNARLMLPYETSGQTWRFELTAIAGGVKYRGVTEEIELNLKNNENPDTEINFVLSLNSVIGEGNGNFAYTIDYSTDSSAQAVTRAVVNFEALDRNPSEVLSDRTYEGAAISGKKFTITASDIPYGKYRARITLYSGEIVAGKWQELIIVYPELTSSKIQNIKLKSFVHFTYVLNDEDDETLVFNGDDFIKKSSTMVIPSPSREEYVFIGWYTDSELTAAFNIADCELEQTLYAKWGQKNFNASFAETPAIIDGASGGTIDSPIVINVNGSYSEETMAQIKTSLKANTHACFNINLSEVTGLLEFPEEAFKQCTSLAGITLPQSLTKIDSRVFYGTGIKEIIIPDSVTAIDTQAFLSCENLDTVTFGAGSQLNTLGYGAFAECEALTSITLPESLTTLGERVFAGSGLTSIVIPKNVTNISGHAFYYCDSLESVTFEENSSVTLIDDYAFQNSGLTSIVIPQSVEELNCAFYEATNLASVTFEENSSLTTIGNYCFAETALTSIVIPDSVTTIEAGVFIGSSLSSITLGNGITQILQEMFSNCSNLTSISLSENITEIDSYAFNNSGLTSINIPDSVTSIGQEAFKNCSNLKTVTIGSGVTTIGTGAFKNCQFDSFTINPGAAIVLENGILYNADRTQIVSFVDSSLTAFTIPASVTDVAIDDIWSLSNLTTITVASGNTVYSSADGVLFSNDGTILYVCPRAKTGSYTIPESVTKIESWAFYQCTGLSAIVSERNWVSITSDGAFIAGINNTLKYYMAQLQASLVYTSIEVENVPEVTVYASEELDYTSGTYTTVEIAGQSYNGRLYKITTTAEKTYTVNWLDGHPTSVTNIPDDFNAMDSKIRIYNSNFEEIKYIDDDQPVEFTASSSTTYLLVGAYGNNECKCAFRVWGPKSE